METLIMSIHFVVSVVLVIAVLLQAGKGASLGAAFGAGSSQTMFGARGAATFLSKLTTIVAVIFFATSIFLAQQSRSMLQPKSVLDKVPVSQVEVGKEPQKNETKGK
ncbi:MAG: preprotein translocase subunit SecG [bacterium]|nr:preprotein translocase subunit SecG [bacterium]